MNYKVNDENILCYAFRYALGRRTYAVSQVVGMLKDNWDLLKSHTRKQIKDEILRYEELYGDLGHECDRVTWYEILEWSE